MNLNRKCKEVILFDVTVNYKVGRWTERVLTGKFPHIGTPLPRKQQDTHFIQHSQTLWGFCIWSISIWCWILQLIILVLLFPLIQFTTICFVLVTMAALLWRRHELVLLKHELWVRVLVAKVSFHLLHTVIVQCLTLIIKLCCQAKLMKSE